MTKSERMVKMLGLIYERPGELGAKQLAELCDVSERGVYRVVKTWLSVGVYIRFNGGGYNIVDIPLQWRGILKQRRLVNAVIDLLALGIEASKDRELKEQGKKVLKSLGVVQA